MAESLLWRLAKKLLTRCNTILSLYMVGARSCQMTHKSLTLKRVSVLHKVSWQCVEKTVAEENSHERIYSMVRYF